MYTLAQGAKENAKKPRVHSMICGSVLGDGWGERRGKSTRWHLHVSTKNMEYLQAFQQFFHQQGLAPEKGKLQIVIYKKSVPYYTVKMRSYSFSEWNWIHDAFYKNGEKTVPANCENLLSEQALATWFMDDGGLSTVGCQLSTNAFPREGLERLQSALRSRYGLHWTIQRQRKQWVLQLGPQEYSCFANIVRPFLVHSMLYKLHFR